MNTQGEVVCGTAEVERIAQQMRATHRLETFRRRQPVGAELLPSGVGTHFRVWAPSSKACSVELYSNLDATGPEQSTALERDDLGYFSGVDFQARAGSLYRFRLDRGSYPDPASRFQPRGPHGPSEVIDPGSFVWADAAWKGAPRRGQVIYEMHVGTFTAEGTWAAAARQLPELARIGITLLEIMPVADFPGRFGWGYDGVNLFAPTRLYGRPDDFRSFVNDAHRAGVGVILDVVYNHLGPDGNHAGSFSPAYFSEHYQCEWGEALNFDGKNSLPVREFFLSNASYWIEEYHLDGLRLDATQQIFDSSEKNIIAEITDRARGAAGDRDIFIVGENEPQHTDLVRPVEQGGQGLDALWNDDYHHTARVAATGKNEAYYTDYKGTPQEFISAIKWGYLYQGQWYKWQKQRRGQPALDIHPSQFVTFLQNHDQVANSLRGKRLHEMTSPGRYRALTALLLLGPNTPMLFQGQEFAASTPFYYFADHNAELAKLVETGRRKFLTQFKSIACPECEGVVPAPGGEETFHRCVLDFRERERHEGVYRLHGDLLRLRRDDPVFSHPCARGVDGAVLAVEAFVFRFFGEAEDRLLIVNLGSDLHLNPAPEPLLAPPAGTTWETIFSTEAVCYGGGGTPCLESDENWWIPGHAAVALAPKKETNDGKGDSQD